MLYPDCCILVFARAPVEGQVNTRLIPALGAERATALHKELLDRRLSQLAEAALCDVILMCTPDTEHAFFRHYRQQYGLSLAQQVGEDLGGRMRQGAARTLEKYEHCIIVGTDAPALGADDIKQAIVSLRQETEVVFVPAEDGGYVLLGLKQAYNCLFENIPWGSDRVLQQSRLRLAENEIDFRELASCWDIDRPADYQRYLRMKAVAG